MIHVTINGDMERLRASILDSRQVVAVHFDAVVAVSGQNLLDEMHGQKAAHVGAWRFRIAAQVTKRRTEMRRQCYWQP